MYFFRLYLVFTCQTYSAWYSGSFVLVTLIAFIPSVSEQQLSVKTTSTDLWLTAERLVLHPVKPCILLHLVDPCFDSYLTVYIHVELFLVLQLLCFSDRTLSTYRLKAGFEPYSTLLQRWSLVSGKDALWSPFLEGLAAYGCGGHLGAADSL